MSETPKNTATSPTPSKRRGLSLPPRGQALSRLQDLEADLPASKSEDAVNTAMSNAVDTAIINAVSTANPPDEAKARPKRERPLSGAGREPTTRITVDMPDSLHRRLSLLGVEERRSLKDLVIEAVEKTYFGGT